MTHPFEKHKETHRSRKAAHKMVGGKSHYKDGGKVHGHIMSDKKLGMKKDWAPEHKAAGGAVTPRLDKRARGGKTKHHTKINILVAPHGGDASSAPPAMGGGAPPMPPKAPMVPPGPMGSGAPPMPAKPAGGPGIPGMMKRGGRAISGIASKENLKDWAEYSSKNTRYAEGGGVGVGAGGATGIGRLRKSKQMGFHHAPMKKIKED